MYEAVINMDSYLDNIYVSIGARNFYDQGTLPEQYAQYSDNYIPNTGVELDVVALYKQKVLDITKNRAFMGIWQVFQATNVLKRPIRSVFPHIGNENVIKDLNRTVYCIDTRHNAKSPINIMWTPMQVKNSRPCHFVPLLRVVRKICKISICNKYATLYLIFFF